MAGKIALVATLDSKGAEAAFLKGRLEEAGRKVIVLDIGSAGTPAFKADFTREEILSQGDDPAADADDPRAALGVMAKGAAMIVRTLVADGTLGAIAGIGGGKGAGVFHEITKDLPYGFPKLLISSARPALLAEIATTSDTILMPTLVDLFGVNDFTRAILDNAAGALAGLDWRNPARKQGRTVAITAFGVTTKAVEAVKGRLNQAGIEAVVFPANGAGGRTMEALIAKGQFDGVIDLTTTEMADLLLGGTASAGEARLTAAAATGIPQVIAPGAIDMVNFGPPETVPARFAGRRIYRHTPMTTLVRTTPDEAAEIGRMTAERLNQSAGETVVFWPALGVSDYDRPGRPFHDPEANRAWLDGLRANLRGDIPVIETENHINDLAFAERCADWMIDKLGANDEELLS